MRLQFVGDASSDNKTIQKNTSSDHHKPVKKTTLILTNHFLKNIDFE